jgi:uncharacterized membrane protein
MSLYHYIFIVTAFAAIFIQGKTRSYQDLLSNTDEKSKTGQSELRQLLKIRRFMSPFIAGLTAVLIMVLTLEKGLLHEFLPRIFVLVWLLASFGDVFMEGAYTVTDKKRQDELYLIGMILFMVMTVLLGLGLILNAQKSDLALSAHLVSILLPLLLGLGAFTTLKVDKETLIPMMVYALSVSILLCGGIYSIFAGQLQLAFIGIGYFCSDWFVGQRDFGKRKYPLLDRWILLIILILYYSIMLVSLDVIVRLS